MKIEYKSMYWNNTLELINASKTVMEHFNIPVEYVHAEGVVHGTWMSEELEKSSADIVVFFDGDCVPINKFIIDKCINYVKHTKSFVGVAQCSNHIPPATHIYASPVFMVVWRQLWVDLGKPNLSPNYRSDTAEELSHVAEGYHVTYKCIYPTKFEAPSTEGFWRLGNYGYFGVGTVFGNDDLYHLYQGRVQQNVELYKKRCKEIIEGTFDSTKFLDCKEGF